mmetsp:Transcript_132814/g.424934  ORF Transcript_132814/g.424934 Transcript_132814/m.424934 type:complete len:237 (-) Transcript_132814:6-716(-)
MLSALDADLGPASASPTGNAMRATSTSGAVIALGAPPVSINLYHKNGKNMKIQDLAVPILVELSANRSAFPDARCGFWEEDLNMWSSAGLEDRTSPSGQMVYQPGVREDTFIANAAATGCIPGRPCRASLGPKTTQPRRIRSEDNVHTGDEQISCHLQIILTGDAQQRSGILKVCMQRGVCVCVEYAFRLGRCPNTGQLEMSRRRDLQVADVALPAYTLWANVICRLPPLYSPSCS